MVSMFGCIVKPATYLPLHQPVKNPPWTSETEIHARLAYVIFDCLFQSCNHDLHPPPAWISALWDQPWQLRASEHRLHLQAGSRYRQPTGPPLCSIPAKHQFTCGQSGGWLGGILLPVHNSCGAPHSAVEPGEPLQTGWPPGLRLLPWNIYSELPRWGCVSCWVWLLWKPNIDLVSVNPWVPESACLQLGFSLWAVFVQSRILGGGRLLSAVCTLFFHFWACGGYVSFSATALARAGSFWLTS